MLLVDYRYGRFRYEVTLTLISLFSNAFISLNNHEFVSNQLLEIAQESNSVDDLLDLRGVNWGAAKMLVRTEMCATCH